jgi:hypothetical protein
MMSGAKPTNSHVKHTLMPSQFKHLRTRHDVNVPIVSAIIEREHDGAKEILVQTRWKPERDPQ